MKPQHTTHASRLALDDIIPHLRKARTTTRNGLRQVVACCPAHDDTNPSLSITETADGKLLWHCHAGCSQEAVQQALERLADVNRATVKVIPPREKQSTSKQSAPTEPLTLEMLARAKHLVAVKLYDWGVRTQSDGTIAIPYLTRDGELSAVQFRSALTGDNRFKWRKDDIPILYGLWRISEWDTADTLYLTEGTTDCWSMWHADLPALGIPSATTWKPEWWDELHGFQRIVVIPDTDSAGAQLVEKLSHTVPMELSSRVYVLRLPDGVKDVNELWQRENGDVERFKQALAGCTVEPLMGVPTDEVEPFPIVWGNELKTEVAHAIVPNLLYAERITILAGEAGVGKTTFALEMADALTRTGKLWNGTVEVQPARILWLDFDHSWNRLQEILDTYYGFHQRAIAVLPREQLEPLSWETLPRYRRTIEHFGIDLIVADTAFDWLDVQDGNDETEARVKLQLIRELIAGTDCAVLLLHHTRKTAGDGASTTALAGAHRWAAKVDVVAYLRSIDRDGMDVVKLIVAKDRDGERREMELQRVSRKFIPLQRSAVPTGDWGVVKAYLQQHGEATYKELLDVLTQAGMRINERTFQTRVKRWEKRGLVIVEKRGYPATAYVKLPVVQFTHPQSSTLQTAQTVQTAQTAQTGETGETEPTATSLALEEVGEHTASLSCNTLQTEQSLQTDTPTTTTTDGSSLHSLRSLRSLHTPNDGVQTALQTDGNGEPQSQVSPPSPVSYQQFTMENNPATEAGYELPQPQVSDGSLFTLTNSNHTTVQQSTQHPQVNEWLDTSHQRNGGAMQMMEQPKRTNLVDTRVLFITAQQVGFPRFTVVHSNGKRLDIAGTRDGWSQAVPTLAREKLQRETYLALTRCRTRDETQPIVLKMEQPDRVSFSTVWRVELTALEWVDTPNGKRLKWVFRTLDDNRTLTATTKYSTEPDSKCARWITALLNQPNPPIDTLDLSQLVGRTAGGVIVHKHTPDGSEQLELSNLVRV
jgi:Mrp family chromosome partitioning ATPase